MWKPIEVQNVSGIGASSSTIAYSAAYELVDEATRATHEIRSHPRGNELSQQIQEIAFRRIGAPNYRSEVSAPARFARTRLERR